MLHDSLRPFRPAIFLMLLLIALSSAVFAQSEKVLYGFQAPGDGAVLFAGLIRDPAGNFYGTTADGGANGRGTIFKLDLAGNETVLHSFNGTDGSTPWSTLVRDTAGNLFGTTYLGGASNSGTVFKLDSTGTLTVLYSFSGGADGRGPVAGLVLDAAGNMYGTTYYGGDLSCNSNSNPSGCGVVFKVNPAGKQTVLHAFTSGGDGVFPLGGLTAVGGILYGTTVGGGTQGWGTVYKVNRNGLEKVLHSFIASATTDAGVAPLGRLLHDNAGNLYGTTSFGGNENDCLDFNGCGAVFKLDSSGNLTVLYAFQGGNDGQGPFGGLVQDDQGNLYGTTSGGGAGGLLGTVFKVDPSGNETVLHSFNGTDGAYPYYGTLLRDRAGNLYGTTSSGGTNIDNLVGVVFKIKP